MKPASLAQINENTFLLCKPDIEHMHREVMQLISQAGFLVQAKSYRMMPEMAEEVAKKFPSVRHRSNNNVRGGNNNNNNNGSGGGGGGAANMVATGAAGGETKTTTIPSLPGGTTSTGSGSLRHTNHHGHAHHHHNNRGAVLGSSPGELNWGAFTPGGGAAKHAGCRGESRPGMLGNGRGVEVGGAPALSARPLPPVQTSSSGGGGPEPFLYLSGECPPIEENKHMGHSPAASVRRRVPDPVSIEEEGQDRHRAIMGDIKRLLTRRKEIDTGVNAGLPSSSSSSRVSDGGESDAVDSYSDSEGLNHDGKPMVDDDDDDDDDDADYLSEEEEDEGGIGSLYRRSIANTHKPSHRSGSRVGRRHRSRAKSSKSHHSTRSGHHNGDEEGEENSLKWASSSTRRLERKKRRKRDAHNASISRRPGEFLINGEDGDVDGDGDERLGKSKGAGRGTTGSVAGGGGGGRRGADGTVVSSAAAREEESTATMTPAQRALQLQRQQQRDRFDSATANNNRLFESMSYDEYLQAHVTHLAYGGTCLAVLLSAPNAVERLKELVGPENPVDARRHKPGSLRARLGTDLIHNAVYAAATLSEANTLISIVFGYSPQYSAATRGTDAGEPLPGLVGGATELSGGSPHRSVPGRTARPNLSALRLHAAGSTATSAVVNPSVSTQGGFGGPGPAPPASRGSPQDGEPLIATTSTGGSAVIARPSDSVHSYPMIMGHNGGGSSQAPSTVAHLQGAHNISHNNEYNQLVAGGWTESPSPMTMTGRQSATPRGGRGGVASYAGMPNSATGGVSSAGLLAGYTGVAEQASTAYPPPANGMIPPPASSTFVVQSSREGVVNASTSLHHVPSSTFQYSSSNANHHHLISGGHSITTASAQGLHFGGQDAAAGSGSSANAVMGLPLSPLPVAAANGGAVGAEPSGAWSSSSPPILTVGLGAPGSEDHNLATVPPTPPAGVSKGVGEAGAVGSGGGHTVHHHAPLPVVTVGTAAADPTPPSGTTTMLMDSVVDERIRRVQRQLDEDREAVQLKSGVLRARELDLLLREQSLRRSTRLWTEPAKPVPLSAALAAAAAVQRGNSTGGGGAGGRFGGGTATSTGADFALYDENNTNTGNVEGGYAAMAAAAAWIQRQPSTGFSGGGGIPFAASPRLGGVTGSLLQAPPPGVLERRSSWGTGAGAGGGGGNSPNQFSAYHRRFSSLASAAASAGVGGASAGGGGAADFGGWLNDYFANPSVFQRFSTTMLGSPGLFGDMNNVNINASPHINSNSNNNNNNRRSITFNSTVTQNQQQHHQNGNYNGNNHLFVSGGSNHFLPSANGSNWMLMGSGGGGTGAVPGTSNPIAGTGDSMSSPPQRLFHFIPNPCVEAADIPELVKDGMRRHALFCALDTNERGWLTREDMIALVLRSPGLHLHDDAEQTAAVIRSLERIVDKYAPTSLSVSSATTTTMGAGMGSGKGTSVSVSGIHAGVLAGGGYTEATSSIPPPHHLNTSSNNSSNSLPPPPLPLASAPDSPHSSAGRHHPLTCGSPFIPPPITTSSSDVQDNAMDNANVQGTAMAQTPLSPHRDASGTGGGGGASQSGLNPSSGSPPPSGDAVYRYAAAGTDTNPTGAVQGGGSEYALPHLRHNSGNGHGGLLATSSSVGSGPLSTASPLSARVTLPVAGGRGTELVQAANHNGGAQTVTQNGSTRRKPLHKKEEVMLNFDAFSEILLYLMRL